MSDLVEPFVLRVVLACLLASVACGVIGSFVVARRIATLSGGLAHAAFGGVGLGYLLGFSPLLGAAGFGVAAALAIGTATRRLRADLDTWIATVWAVGMALGVLFVALAPGYAPDLGSYLFGSLLLVPWAQLGWIAAVDAAILSAVALLYQELRAIAFDEEFAEVTGLPVEALFLGLLALTALAIVAVLRVVGVILALALLTLPAAAARQWTSSLGPMMALATLAAALCTLGGLVLSWILSVALEASVPPGPVTVLLAAALYATSTALRASLKRRAGSASLPAP